MDSNADEVRDEATVTTFDARTARAVVTVLRRAGIAARAVADAVDADEVDVRVPAPQRNAAMAVLAERMEEVRDEALRADTRERRPQRLPTPPPGPQDDDVRGGPPLVMERFANLGLAVVIVMVPLLALTLATPSLPRQARVIGFVVVVVALVVYVRRRRR